MVDISSQNNKINVTVSSSGNTANTNVTPDYAQYYSEKSKEWAISNRIIDNTDYSSKYYANESKKQADISTAKTTEVIESGNTAVSNIESARNSAIIDVNTAGATQVALATEQATIATNKASEVIESGNTALSNIDTAKSEALTEVETLHSSSVTDITGLKNTSIADITNLKNTSISDITTTKDNAITTITTQETTSKNNIIATGNEQVDRVIATGNNYDNLTHKNITNCLLEVPQKIKLELVDGTLTLKAGSQVIVPNGFEADGTTPKFDEVVIESDKTSTYNGARQGMICYNATNQSLTHQATRNCTSGATSPATSWSFWYDTTNNKVKKFENDATTPIDDRISLPIAIYTSTTEGYQSIDQVFNGMGYIGSTVWVDKGVKGLIPNGRNEDGSLNNVESTTSKVATVNVSGNLPTIIAVFQSGDLGTSLYYTEQKEQPTRGQTLWYKPNENILSRVNINGSLTKPYEAIIIATNDCTNGVISNFQPKLPFRAVDAQDCVNKSGDTMTGDLVVPKLVVNSRDIWDSVTIKPSNNRDPYGNYIAEVTTSLPNNTAFKLVTFMNPDNGYGMLKFLYNNYQTGVNYDFGLDSVGNMIHNGHIAHQIKETYVNGTSGYRIWSDGYCEQWGYAAYSATVTVNFLKNFKDTNYNTSVSQYRNATQTYSCTTYNRTASSFQIICSTSYTGYYWRACGYLASGQY